MNEIDFRKWMLDNGKNPKVTCDTISRIKKLEKELGNIDIDDEYKKDQCSHLLSLFENTGRNERMNQYNTNLPIGKYYLGTYKYSISLYCDFISNKN